MKKPIVYNDEVRAFTVRFIRKKLNAQYAQLHAKNANAFVWIDDPGLEFVFNAICGYDNVKARRNSQISLMVLTDHGGFTCVEDRTGIFCFL